MKKFIINSLALLSLSANSFAGICVHESANVDNFISKLANISIPQSLDTINSAEKILQITQAFSELATKGPVQSGLGNYLIEDADQLERRIKAKLYDNRILEEELRVAYIEMDYCLRGIQNTSCIDSVNKLVESYQKGLLQVRSIHSSGLEVKEVYGTLGEKLIALSSAGQSAQMTDFKPTLEKAQQLASKRDSYLNQLEQDMRVRGGLSQAMKECLNSNN